MDDNQALTLILKSKGTVERGLIHYAGDDPAVMRAISYLCQEWDYAYAGKKASILKLDKGDRPPR